MANVLIIDDDKSICDALVKFVIDSGHKANYALNLEDGTKLCRLNEFALVFLDVRLPDGNGLEKLPEFQEAPSAPEIIIITGEGDPDGAELAITNGAWDYIEKPLSLRTIRLPFLRALQHHTEKVKKLTAIKRHNIIGNSPKLKQCLDLLAQASGCQANTLITGQTGTGKEVFARAIHENSSGFDHNFVVVDCGSLPETLVESTLFGNVKGAFTGADKDKDGLVKAADGGTLFLDEIGELPLSIQKNFLRVIQEHSFMPVGGKKELKSDFRLIAATNRDLETMSKAGAFREDLLHRLRAITINLPPVRERKGDIKLLVQHFMNRICERYGHGIKGISPEVQEIFELYDWPGNVREISHVTESMLAALRDDPMVYPDHLPTYLRVHMARYSVNKKKQRKASTPSDNNSHTLDVSLKHFREKTIIKAERQYLQMLMKTSKWDIKKSCQISGLSRTRLYTLLKKYDISRRQE